MLYHRVILSALMIACLTQADIGFAAVTSTATAKVQSITFDTISTINDIKYPVNINTSWVLKSDAVPDSYLDSNKIKQSVSAYLSSHTKNSNNLEALTRDLAYNMLDQYPQLASFTITFNVLATGDSITSDFSSVTASYHN